MKKTILETLFFKLTGTPTPSPLIRNHQPLSLDELQHIKASIFNLHNNAISQCIDQALTEAGGHVFLCSEHTTQAKIDALVLNVSGLTQPSDFDALYQASHHAMAKLNHNARIIIITDACKAIHSVDAKEKATDAFQASIVPALAGFMRALSKEVGRLGATVNMIHIQDKAISRLPAVLHFILSRRSAFISAQTFTISQRAKNNLPTYTTPLLSGKRIIVTGVARGIGLAIAQALTREGAQVIGIDVPTPSLHTHMQRLNGLALELDITSDEAANKLCDFLHSHTGAVHGIIHNAGITRDKTLKHMSDAQWQSVLKVNLIAPVQLTQALLAQNLILNGGRIIGLSSISGIAGNAGQSNYALTKGGLAGYMQGLSEVLSEQGITANAIAPGFIETQMTAKIPFMVRTIGRYFNALKQGGLPEDVAELAVFLSSDHACGITGHNLRVCGHNLLGK